MTRLAGLNWVVAVSAQQCVFVLLLVLLPLSVADIYLLVAAGANPLLWLHALLYGAVGGALWSARKQFRRGAVKL